jgi:hypothetical protein
MVFSKVGPNQSIEWGQIGVSKSPVASLLLLRQAAPPGLRLGMGSFFGVVKQSQAKISWRCRSCARLRYSSEGGYLLPTGFGRLGVMLRAYGGLPRPESWLPYVFTSIDDPRLDGFVRQNCP